MFGFRKFQKPIFMDHASGTAIADDVYVSMRTYFQDDFYNPSGLHKEAVSVKQDIETARIEIAQALKVRPSEIFFADGGTEANNMAIIGIVRRWQKQHPGKIPHIITTTIEHSSVLECYNYLQDQGVQVSFLPVDEHGLVSMKALKKSLQEYENTVLISVGYVNGEIGTIQDIRGIMKIVRHFRKHHKTIYPYVHTDAVQAVNYVERIGIPQLGVDLMTINGSKIYGPKKIAVLFKKSTIEIEPLLFGGNQEFGLRPGTENVAYIIGLARSLSLARKLQAFEQQRLQNLQQYFIAELLHAIPGVIVNTSPEHSIPNIVNISVPDISHEEILIRLDARGIMCSMKSACTSGEEEDSHVIRAIAKGDRPTGSLRFSMGRSTTKKDIDRVIKELKEIVEGMNETYKKYYKA